MSQTQQKTPHSIKVPKLYKVATSILKDFKNGQGSVKTLVYEGEGKGERRGRRVAGVVERRDDVPILVALTAKVPRWLSSLAKVALLAEGRPTH